MKIKTPNLANCVTPWTKGHRLDEAGLRRYLRFLGKHNVGVCLGAYTFGEGLLLVPKEKRRLYEIGVEELSGKVPVFAVSLGYTSTAVVIKSAKEASMIGVDGVQLYPPRPIADSSPIPLPMLETFYREVCEAVEGPLILGLQLESMPERAFPIDLIASLISDYPHIRGINCTTRDQLQLARVTRAFGEKLPVRCAGILEMIPQHINAGGAGFLGFECNIAPTWINSIVDSVQQQDIAIANEYLKKAQALNAIFKLNPVCRMKAAIHLFGYIDNYVRKPYLPVAMQELVELGAALRELGLLDVKGAGG